MNHFSKQDSNKKNANIFMLFAFIVLSNFSVLAQTNTADEKNVIANTTVELTSSRQENVSTASNMNFVLWFMGSKQDPNTTISTEGTNTKRKVMTSGMAPNRLLIKAFLKKATNFESTVA